MTVVQIIPASSGNIFRMIVPVAIVGDPVLQYIGERGIVVIEMSGLQELKNIYKVK